MRVRDPRSLLPSWHRRVVVVSEDDEWARRATRVARALGARSEIVRWSRAARLTGPVGTVVAHVDAARPGVEAALLRWSKRGWQPLTLVWLSPVRGAAGLGEVLDREGYGLRYEGPGAAPVEAGVQGDLGRILLRGGWIVPRFAAALGVSGEPEWVRILALPVLAPRPPGSVRAWRRAAGGLGYAELEAWFRERGAPRPKRVLDRLRLAEGAVWAARRARVPTRGELADHLGYASGRYLGERTKALAGLTAGELVRRPAGEVVDALVAGLRRERPGAGGAGAR